jgi:hypothetical protein
VAEFVLEVCSVRHGPEWQLVQNVPRVWARPISDVCDEVLDAIDYEHFDVPSAIQEAMRLLPAETFNPRANLAQKPQSSARMCEFATVSFLSIRKFYVE